MHAIMQCILHVQVFWYSIYRCIIVLYSLGVCVLYIVMSVFGTSIISLAPIVIIELVGVYQIETMSGIINVFESASFITNAFIASRCKTSKSLSYYYFLFLLIHCLRIENYKKVSRLFVNI